ncbi:MAG: site-2 protease family protein [Bacteroidetes bacterium]|nr:site-2 protease family protein [Bacteroidota bacterium]
MSRTMSEVAFNTIVPSLPTSIELLPFDKDSFLMVDSAIDRKLLINELTKELIILIDGKKNIKDITSQLIKQGRQIDEIQVFNTVKNLESFGLTNGEGVQKKNKPKYLTLSTVLIKEKYVSLVSGWLKFLFHPKVFWSVLLAAILLLAFLFVRDLTWSGIYDSIQPELFLPLAITFFISLLLHELGHATACRYHGSKHGAIGFGFYLFTPVFYADVSDAWKLKSHQRVIIDLAGIFMETLFSLMLAIASYILSEPTLLLIGFMIILNTLKNLNPFLRFDAYWVLSDLLNIPNLRQKSNSKLIDTMKWLVARASNPLKTSKDYFLAGYAFVSFSLMIAFLVAILLFNPNSVLHFPSNFALFVSEIYNHGKSLSFVWYKNSILTMLMPISFYVLLLTILIKNRTALAKMLNY